MRGNKWRALLAMVCFLGTGAAQADDAWADFRDDVIALHEKSIKDRPVRVEEGPETPFVGEAAKGFTYKDFRYYDQATGRLIGYVRRSAGWLTRYYEVEVYIYDDKGRVIRDYAVITLPWQLEHPARTFINLHDYPGELHVFRQFDASGDFFYESCTGKLDGKKVNMQHESIEVGPYLRATPLYQACFARLPMKPGPYLKPQ